MCHTSKSCGEPGRNSSISLGGWAGVLFFIFVLDNGWRQKTYNIVKRLMKNIISLKRSSNAQLEDFRILWMLENVCTLHNMSRLIAKPIKWFVSPAKTQILIRVSAWRRLGSLAIHWAHSEDSDQTGQMPRLIWVFAERTCHLMVLSWGGPPHNETEMMALKSIWACTYQNQQNECTQWRPRSAWASTQSDQSSLCAQKDVKDPMFLHADSKDSDQTGRMPRLIWVFPGHILLVLSCTGSYYCEVQSQGVMPITGTSLWNDNFCIVMTITLILENFIQKHLFWYTIQTDL